MGLSKTMESLVKTNEKVLVEMELTLLLETTQRLEEELKQILSSQ
ncbi:unnamed protein product [marine sediment metagenome]|uniref:Uncharacterized protein n=1 Tax=marine sediment metagenome TaxID=412755 RepID=X1F500_9ZZZZ